ncbi:BRO family protein [Ruminococcus flavefaciens]|uniref:Prophage antirepressor-like protein n=1 Tax=Ruminococcus flavefaciens TaxID=1265 RepID=A0A315XT45_RUMFL|nr:phage antirepressor KilAC domain-containing protein [Ruminococcus flavefaciens]PWJ09899.1 prophage antirepressor-like protein [Ruminococcus flavefaciens]SSA52190.1 Prophage antirepressor [Ruminococcus flavefaciens]
MNEMMIFNNPEFGSVRTVCIDGEPWLVGKDVALILKYTNPQKAIRDHVDPEDRTVNESFTVNGTMATLINESGFYSLVLSSKMPNAKKFKRWVTAEVLPTIRKTGGYVANEDVFVETYLPFADEPIKQLFRIQCRVINQLNDRIRKDEPKVKFADHVGDSTNVIDVNRMAKLCADHGIRIGRNRLFAWMRSRGILMGGNIPYQEYIENGYFRVKESVYETNGQKRTYQQTFVTGKGQQYILSRLMREYGGVINA